MELPLGRSWRLIPFPARGLNLIFIYIGSPGPLRVSPTPLLSSFSFSYFFLFHFLPYVLDEHRHASLSFTFCPVNTSNTQGHFLRVLKSPTTSKQASFFSSFVFLCVLISLHPSLAWLSLNTSTLYLSCRLATLLPTTILTSSPIRAKGPRHPPPPAAPHTLSDPISPSWTVQSPVQVNTMASTFPNHQRVSQSAKFRP